MSVCYASVLFLQDFGISVGHIYLFLAPKVKNDAGFKLNVHRLQSLSAKARQIFWRAKAEGPAMK